MADADDITVEAGTLYLVKGETLLNLIAKIASQKAIPGDGISLEETADGIVISLATPE